MRVSDELKRVCDCMGWMLVRGDGGNFAVLATEKKDGTTTVTTYQTQAYTELGLLRAIYESVLSGRN